MKTDSLILVEKGIMDNPKVDAIFGLHNHPDIPAGKIGLKLGGLMAAVDTILEYIFDLPAVLT
ncbi:hypothetical protein I6U48_02355 [Clostridium sp. PL3]|uniref:Uncharacterized protein n=1 Tax=Clostridium thailandense TaxID=2794346 RepID=A0A949TTT1_9CLOT|nr:hypothetical protein [Clostridium thailandense]MBV7271756.1 hypothetical protein [Clostridium thailandense]